MDDLIAIINNDDGWVIEEEVRNDELMVTRFRYELTTKLDKKKYSNLIRVFWNYSEHSTGLPSPKDVQLMNVFENRLAKALEHDVSGILVAVLTSKGRREWVYYTTSIEVFSDRLHRIPQEVDRYPINIHAYRDEDWKYFFGEVYSESAVNN